MTTGKPSTATPLALLLTACLALGPVGGADARGAGATGEVEPTNTDEVLANPGMGIVHFYYSSRIWAYGSQQESGDVLDWMPGTSVIYMRLPWCYLEPAVPLSIEAERPEIDERDIGVAVIPLRKDVQELLVLGQEDRVVPLRLEDERVLRIVLVVVILAFHALVQNPLRRRDERVVHAGDAEEGVYRWDLVESKARPWLKAGKKIAFRISCQDHTIVSTPKWVLDKGVKGEY